MKSVLVSVILALSASPSHAASLDEVREACQLASVNDRVLGSGFSVLISQARSVADLAGVYSFAVRFKTNVAGNAALQTEMASLGVAIFPIAGPIATGRGTLCQLIQLSTSELVVAIQGPTKLRSL